MPAEPIPKFRTELFPASAVGEEGLSAPRAIQQIIQSHGRTFAFAARFLPPAPRQAATILYAFFRTLDDLVDERPPGSDVAPIREELAAWRAWFRRGEAQPAPREPLGSLLFAVLARYQIPTSFFLDFLDGLAGDLQVREIVVFGELEEYCYRVASTVGLAMSFLLGGSSHRALSAARALGIGMQLTNILRDIGSDLVAGRLYLPREELLHFGSSRAHLQALLQRGGQADGRFRALMRFQIARADRYYLAGLAGVRYLAPDCRLPILLAGRLYQKILRVIERNDYDVLRRRAATSTGEKVLELLSVLLQAGAWQWEGAAPREESLSSPPDGEAWQ